MGNAMTEEHRHVEQKIDCNHAANHFVKSSTGYGLICSGCYPPALVLGSPKPFDVESPGISRAPLIGNPSDRQIGGDHYRKFKIQPIEYVLANNMGYLPGCALKYLTRYKDKGGAQDIHKAIHYLELILEFEYGEKKHD